MQANQYGPYELGYICATMGYDNEKLFITNLKHTRISSEFFLKLERIKEELLVIAK